mgnify:CR=1 FL=1
MSLPARILAALIVAGLLVALGFRLGIKAKQAEWDAVTVKAQQEAEQIQDQNNAQLAKQNQAHADAVRDVNRKLADALERLRKRPERRPEPARAACEGGTGAELSRSDARFLAGLAARADSIRVGLEACYEFADKVR